MPTIDSGVLTQLTEHYDQDLHLIAFKDRKEVTPLLALAEQRKIKDGFGRQFVVRYQTNEGAAVAAQPDIADLIVGDGNAGGRPNRNRWVVSRISLDAPFVFERDEILALDGKSPGEQFDVISSEMDNAVLRLRNVIAEQVSGKGWGALAQITAITSTTITVAPQLANRFRIGWRLVACADEDTSVLLGTPAGAALRVTGVNPKTGVITLSGNPQTTWTNSASLFVFRQGNRMGKAGDSAPGATDANRLCMTGCEAWVNPTDAAGTYWGVARSGDPDQCGYEVDCTGLDTHEACLAVAEQAFYQGRKIDTILIPGLNWKLLNLDKDAVKVIEVNKNGYTIGFEAFQMPTSFGTVNVAPDAFLKPGALYAGPFMDKEDGPRLYYAGKNLINLDNFDGLEFQRQATTGSRDFKGQFFFSGQFVIPSPGMYFKGTSLTQS